MVVQLLLVSGLAAFKTFGQKIMGPMLGTHTTYPALLRSFARVCLDSSKVMR
jgi:hypothetical protein